MKLNEYQIAAMKFRLPTADAVYAQLNLAGEVGEFLSLVAKARRDGLNTEEAADAHFTNVKKELGDILWQLSAVAWDYGLHLSEIAEGNLDKLGSRKARGQIQGSGDDR